MEDKTKQYYLNEEGKSLEIILSNGSYRGKWIRPGLTLFFDNETNQFAGAEIHLGPEYKEVEKALDESTQTLTQDTTDRLAVLAKENGVSVDDVVRKLLAGEGKELSRKYKNGGLPWSHIEDAELLSEFNGSIPITMIAMLHGRSEGAITSRLKKLGLIYWDPRSSKYKKTEEPKKDLSVAAYTPPVINKPEQLKQPMAEPEFDEPPF